MKKRLISLLIVLTLLAVFVPIQPVPAYATGIAFDASTGNTGTGASSNANLNHAANVYVTISVTYAGTTSPTVTIGGVNVPSIAKKSNGTTMTVEVFTIYRADAANESIVVTFGGNTRHSWSACSYTGVNSSTPTEDITTASGSGASPQTSSVTVIAGTASRLLVNFNGSASVRLSGTITIGIAPANGETEEQENDLSAGVLATAFSSQIQDIADSAQRDLKATHTISGGTGINVLWATIGLGLVPAVTASAPTVVTGSASLIQDKTASTSGNVTTIGSANITNWGTQYGTSTGNYTANFTNNGTQGAAFSWTDNLTGLTSNITYYYRSFAISSTGTGNGTELTFRTGWTHIAFINHVNQSTINKLYNIAKWTIAKVIGIVP